MTIVTTATSAASLPADGTSPDHAMAGPAAGTDAHHEALAAWIAAQLDPGRTLIVGINGAQGSGKSTLAAFLQQRLQQTHARHAVVLSIDDFYATRAERQTLASTIHPLLATRGVPGTHDIRMAMQTLRQLRSLGRDQDQSRSLRLPRFVKVDDDRADPRHWPACSGPVDVVLFEGWCVGTPPEDEAALQQPVNRLEADEDADGRWRAHVNRQLGSSYASLFSMLDRLVLLQAPGFEVVHGWRLEQEAGNVAAAGRTGSGMSAAALQRFIAHYERLTRHALRLLPARADVVFELDARRRVGAARYR